MMSVLLEQDVSGLGEKGSIVEVKPAYAENVLLTTGKGTIASQEILDRVAAEQAAAAAAAAAARKRADVDRDTLQGKFAKGLVIEVQMKDGQIERPITTKDVAADLSRAGVTVAEESIEMADITELGSSIATVALHPDVSMAVKVVVEKSKITFS